MGEARLNYVVQLSVVITGMLAGQTDGLAWLVFQNPDSLMLELDLVGWFLLSLAFLSVVPFFQVGRLSRAIRYLLIANAFVGIVLLASFETRIPAIGQILLATMSVFLSCVDTLLVVFFR